MCKNSTQWSFCVLFILISQLTVNAELYKYGQSGETSFNNGDWISYKDARSSDIVDINIAKGDYSHFYFSGQLGAWNDRYSHGASIRWTAPNDEIVTWIEFYTYGNNGNSYYKTVVASPNSSTDPLLTDNTVLWRHTGVGGTGTHTVDASYQNNASIDLGFLGQETYVGFHSYFDDVVIHTAIPFYSEQVQAQPTTSNWQWHPMAIGGGGNCSGLTFDPEYPKRVYLRVDVAGVIRTDNDGNNWRSINEGMHGLASGNYSIGALAIDPDDNSILYASIGRSWQQRNGIIKSQDYGETWELLTTTVSCHGEGGFGRKCGGPGILIDPSNTDRIYVIDNQHNSGNGGVWVTGNGGQTWWATGLNSVRVNTIRFKPGNTNTIYAGCINSSGIQGGLYVSTDQGSSWTSVGLAGKDVWNFEFETGNPDTIYAVCGLDGVYKTTNGGSTWTAINSGLPLAANGYSGQFFTYRYRALDVDPESPGHLIIAADVIRAIYESTNGGATWQQISISDKEPPTSWMLTPNHLGWATNQVYFSPDNSDTLYLCDIFGTWTSNDGGGNWWINPYGQETSCMVSVLPDSNLDRRLYMGAWDHDMIVYVDYNTNPSGFRPAGLIHGYNGANAHVSGLAQDTANPSKLIGVCHSTCLVRSTDSGQNWTQITSGLPADTTTRLGCPAIASSAGKYFLPVNSTASESGGIYISSNQGISWTKTTGSGLPSTIDVTGYWSPRQDVFAVRSDANLMALCTEGSLYISTNQGANWSNVILPTGVTAGRVALSEQNSSTIFLGAGNNNGLYVSTNYGASWTRILAENATVQSLAVASSNDDRILCHMSKPDPTDTSRIMYMLKYSDDGGANWEELLNPSIAIHRLHDVAFDPHSSTRIYVATYWGGAYAAEYLGN